MKDSTTLSGTDIGITCAKNAASQSFTQWTSLYPFGSASYSLGYAQWCRQPGSFSKNATITIYESKEAIAITNCDINDDGVYAAIAGAIIDPEQNVTVSDAELDGRLYGVSLTGYSVPINTGFLRSDSHFFTHGNAVNNSKFMTFVPQTNSTGSASSMVKYVNNSGVYTTLSGKLADSPIYCMTTLNSTFLGRLRDITVTSALPSNMVVKDSASGSIFGYTLGSSEQSSNDTLLFKY
jgi:hypothetical protein